MHRPSLDAAEGDEPRAGRPAQRTEGERHDDRGSQRAEQRDDRDGASIHRPVLHPSNPALILAAATQVQATQDRARHPRATASTTLKPDGSRPAASGAPGDDGERGMCMNCGCMQPNESHGETANITLDGLRKAAEANDQDLGQTLENIEKTYHQAVEGTEGTSQQQAF